MVITFVRTLSVLLTIFEPLRLIEVERYIEFQKLVTPSFRQFSALTVRKNQLIVDDPLSNQHNFLAAECKCYFKKLLFLLTLRAVFWPVLLDNYVVLMTICFYIADDI